MSDKIKFWFAVTQYYGRNVSDPVLKMYAEDCEKASVGQLGQAFKIYKKTGEAKFFPLPATLMAIAFPEEGVDDLANRVPGLIYDAVRIYGYMDWEGARNHIGTLGEKIIIGYGGWAQFCSNENLGSEGTVRAQMRETAKALIKASKAGTLNTPPRIESSDRKAIDDRSNNQTHRPKNNSELKTMGQSITELGLKNEKDPRG